MLEAAPEPPVPSAPTSPAAGRGRAGALLAIAAWLSLHAGAAAFVQFGFLHVPEDADTDFHVAVGRLIREHGILQAFPWTPFSILADHYADKELLFHLLFVPLAGLDAALAANVVGTLCGAAMLGALFLVLRRERVPFAGLWALVPLLASSAFLYRFTLVRPHLLSIALALVVLWAAARERLRVLAVASVLYPWTYVAWQLPVVLALVAEAARALAGRRPGWRVPAVAAAAVAAGVALHPNGLHLVRFSWTVLSDVLVGGAWAGRQGLELGDEFRAFTLGEWAKLLVPPAVMTVAALGLAWRRRRDDAVPLAFALAASAFFLLTLRTARFTEYFVPLSVAAFALSAGGLRVPALRALRPAAIVGVTLLACAAYSVRESRDLLHAVSLREPRVTVEEAQALRARIPEGAQVFTCEWGLTGTLMLALPERRFMVALDPTLFALKDPERYALWYSLPRVAPPGLAATIREGFGARYVACRFEERFRPFFDRIAFEPGVNTVLMSGLWNVYELREP